MEDKGIRLNASIDPEDYKRLKVKLIMEDKSVAEWVREQVKKEIASQS